MHVQFFCKFKSAIYIKKEKKLDQSTPSPSAFVLKAQTLPCLPGQLEVIRPGGQQAKSPEEVDDGWVGNNLSKLEICLC